MEKISVLMPTYNVALYIEDAVQSILSQSYANLEVIIVDDASTDNTYQILEQLSRIDNRIRLFRNDQNSRIAATLNFALSKASGELLVRMDGDDISHPARIEKLYNFLKANPQICLVGSGIRLIDNFGNEIQRALLPTDYETIKRAILYSSPVAHIWMTYKWIYDKIGSYRFSGVEDYDFLLRIISSNLKVTNIAEYLYDVRLREGNTISTQGIRQRKAFNYVRALYLNKKINDEADQREFERKTSVNSIINYFHKISSGLFNLYLKKKPNLISMFFLCLSIVFSPYYQLQHIIYRYKYKRITTR